jgi:hypothetical protein
MPTKKTTGKRAGVDKQRRINAKKPSGKPFEKGNRIGFQPGKSGNPAGRPKSRTLSEELRARLEEEYPDRPDATYGRMVAETLVDMAIKDGGSIAAISEIFDRVEGRPRARLDVSVEEQKRKMVESALDALMRETGVDRDLAIKDLLDLVPEASQWIQ